MGTPPTVYRQHTLKVMDTHMLTIWFRDCEVSCMHHLCFRSTVSLLSVFLCTRISESSKAATWKEKKISYKHHELGARDTAQWLRSLASPQENHVWFPSTTRQLTSIHISRFRGFNALFWPLWLWYTCGIQTWMHTNSIIHKIKINK